MVLRGVERGDVDLAGLAGVEVPGVHVGWEVEEELGVWGWVGVAVDVSSRVLSSFGVSYVHWQSGGRYI